MSAETPPKVGFSLLRLAANPAHESRSLTTRPYGPAAS